MIYATERDARLGPSINPDTFWKVAGSTGVNPVAEDGLGRQAGTAIVTVRIDLKDGGERVGTSINAAIPLPLRALGIHADDSVEGSGLVAPAAMVETLRQAFGLNITQLAQVLRIERVTVYAWLRTQESGKLNPSNRRRLWILYRIAQRWCTYAQLPGKYLLECLQNTHTTVFEMLCADDLRSEEFHVAYEQLALAMGHQDRIRKHRIEQQQVLRRGLEQLRNSSQTKGLDAN